MEPSTFPHRFSGLHRKAPAERIDEIVRQGLLDITGSESLVTPLDVEKANLMSENVVGVMGFPLSVVPDVPVNTRLVSFPMCTEEPSVVAAVSRAAKILRECGGVTALAPTETVVHGLLQLSAPPHAWGSLSAYTSSSVFREELNQLHARLVARGGGLRGAQLVRSGGEDGYLDLAIACCDAMGANMASLYATDALKLISTRVPDARGLARVVANEETDRTVEVRAEINSAALARALRLGGADGEHGYRASEQGLARAALLLRKAVEIAKFGERCPTRCYTHNKGIMNGVEALTRALGQDTRAIHIANGALAHQDPRNGLPCHVRPLITSRLEGSGDHVTMVMEGSVRAPLGTVGGALKAHAQAKMCVQLIGGTKDAMEATAAIGLCSNLAALLALASKGGLVTAHITLARRTDGLLSEKS
eukprot:gnl/Chilomastix_cuspidata/2405.p1 GENE.gnl/Chilomastix_cuspidata/2405~~gnl/Chilomastix_cuspidata/2405.p1  ORF type:complete len:421 (+),score=41.60 gnl/Chilomastix_cuspidata/2405:38-1300(+)